MFHFYNQVCWYTDSVTTCCTEQHNKVVLIDGGGDHYAAGLYSINRYGREGKP